MVMQGIDSGEGTFAVRDEYIGRNGVVTRQTNLNFSRFIAVALFLEEHFGLITIGRCWWRCQHTVKHFPSGCLFPFIKVFNVVVSPC